jgi:hypothetical protein
VEVEVEVFLLLSTITIIPIITIRDITINTLGSIVEEVDFVEELFVFAGIFVFYKRLNKFKLFPKFI